MEACWVQNECNSIWYSDPLVSKHHNPIKLCLALQFFSSLVLFLQNELKFFFPEAEKIFGGVHLLLYCTLNYNFEVFVSYLSISILSYLILPLPLFPSDGNIVLSSLLG